VAAAMYGGGCRRRTVKDGGGEVVVRGMVRVEKERGEGDGRRVWWRISVVNGGEMRRERKVVGESV
jgi:hypothetical protein